MTQPNSWIGDVPVTLAGRSVVLRPSFAAIAAIEAHFGRGIIDVARDYHAGKITRAADFVALVKAGLAGFGGESAPENPMPENLADAVVETGLAQLVEPLSKFLAHACGVRS